METESNILVLNRELDWLQAVIDQVIRTYMKEDKYEKDWLDIPVPTLSESDSPFAAFINTRNCDIFSRLAIALALAPQLRPEALDMFFVKNATYARQFSEFGGVTDSGHSGFLPTGQTLYFLIAANNPRYLPQVMRLLDDDSLLVKERVLVLSATDGNLPRFSSMLSIGRSWLHYFVTGEEPGVQETPIAGVNRITTPMEWQDLVLDDHSRADVGELIAWLKHSSTLMNDWGLKKYMKPGYRALFYGPPGTGKKLTAALIARESDYAIYKVDLSMMASGEVGGVERSFARLFAMAKKNKWILFFDEADALFGKRTSAASTNDRYANQEVAGLLQLIEDFPGLVILSTNLKTNIDEAFARRFQSLIHFGMPSATERLKLWKQVFSHTCTLHPSIDIAGLAQEYALSGGAIVNVLRHCALSVVESGNTVVSMDVLLAGIRKEFAKGNRVLSNINP